MKIKEILVIIPNTKKTKCSHSKNGISTIEVAYLELERELGYCTKCRKTLIQIGDGHDFWREFETRTIEL